ncbi:MAG TPA: isoamylase early set domain-containing protein [Gemmatimonadales bacterium]
MTEIDPRVHAALDGERDPAGLPPELAAQVRALQDMGAALAAGPPAASVEARVLAALRRPAATPGRRLLRWLTDPRSVTVSLRPVYTLAAAAAIAAVLLIAPGDSGPALGAEEGIAQFVGRFPGAQSVAVVGSFNDWRPGVTPLTDDDHDGIWNANVILPAGQHEYMFVVDGERWVADPLAGRYVADGFGRQNALLFVRPLK